MKITIDEFPYDEFSERKLCIETRRDWIDVAVMIGDERIVISKADLINVVEAIR